MKRPEDTGAPWWLILLVAVPVAVAAGFAIWLLTPAPQPSASVTPPSVSPVFAVQDVAGAAACADYRAAWGDRQEAGIGALIMRVRDDTGNAGVLAAAEQALGELTDTALNDTPIEWAEWTSAATRLETACVQTYGA